MESLPTSHLIYMALKYCRVEAMRSTKVAIIRAITKSTMVIIIRVTTKSTMVAIITAITKSTMAIIIRVTKMPMIKIYITSLESLPRSLST